MGGGKFRFLNCGLLITLFLSMPTLTLAQAIGNIEINDPYTTGSSLGIVSGGVFTSNGWQTRQRTDYIQYNIETCPFGKIEFEKPLEFNEFTFN